MFNESQLGGGKALLPCALMLSTTLILGGCATTGEPIAQSADTAAVGDDVKQQAVPRAPDDPYEGFNRTMYGFNMTVDKYFLKPISDGYKWVTPSFMQTGVTNFFTNLKGINVVLNDVLQGKFSQGARDVGRFTTNSTLGLFGLFDIASEFGLENNVEDFGQTLAVWGVAQGPYLVLPLFGPTTLRDGSAVIFDKAANPGTYVPGSGIVEGINDRANAEGALNFIDEAALDPYVFTRESFLQYRQNLVNDGKSNPSNYDFDVDAEVDVGEITPAKPKSGKETEINGKVNDGNAVQAFDEMSKSFDEAASEFEKASKKMERFDRRRKK